MSINLMNDERLESISAALTEAWNLPTAADHGTGQTKYTLVETDIVTVRDAIDTLLELRRQHATLVERLDEVRYAVSLSDDVSARIARKLLER